MHDNSSKRPIHVLLIEDEPADVLLVERGLRDAAEAGERFHVEAFTTLGEGLERLGKRDIDVVLLDLHVPDSRGLDTVIRVRELDSDVPIVVFTAAGETEMGTRALREGAQDYLVKREVNSLLLQRSIRYALERQKIELEKRKLQERLLRAEKLESLGAFAGGLAFAFNTALGTILEQVDLALLSLSSPLRIEQAKHCVNAIEKASLHAGELVDQLRCYAGAREPRKERVDLTSFVIDMSGLLDAIVSKRGEIDYSLAGNLPAVECDVHQLRQVLVHLVINAVEAIDRTPGVLSITTGQTWVGPDFFAGATVDADPIQGQHVFVRVSDSGRAMDAGMRARIFDPFFTTKFSGRGLGLSAVSGIVRRHGGAIKLDSAPGQGTTLTILLPHATHGRA